MLGVGLVMSKRVVVLAAQYVSRRVVAEVELAQDRG
jgi:hypothetical protein